MIRFRNTHDQPIYVNPEHVLYVTSFEEDVSIVALAIGGAGEQPHAVHIRGSADRIRPCLCDSTLRLVAGRRQGQLRDWSGPEDWQIKGGKRFGHLIAAAMNQL